MLQAAAVQDLNDTYLVVVPLRPESGALAAKWTRGPVPPACPTAHGRGFLCWTIMSNLKPGPCSSWAKPHSGGKCPAMGMAGEARGPCIMMLHVRRRASVCCPCMDVASFWHVRGSG